MEREVIEKQLQKLQQTYSELPEIILLDKETECIDLLTERKAEASLPLTIIRRRFVDVVGGWISYLHSFLLPNQQSMILVHEAENFSEEEKAEILMILNQLMFISRVSAKLELERSPAADAHFLGEYFPKWLEIKAKILAITKKNVAIWQSAIEKREAKQEKGTYFG